MQESNGLLDAQRRPKRPLETIRDTVTTVSAALPDEKLQKKRKEARDAAQSE